jgi:hypothetical protein
MFVNEIELFGQEQKPGEKIGHSQLIVTDSFWKKSALF